MWRMTLLAAALSCTAHALAGVERPDGARPLAAESEAGVSTPISVGGGLPYEDDFDHYVEGQTLCSLGGWFPFDGSVPICDTVFVVADPAGREGLALELNGDLTDDVVQEFDTIRYDLGVEHIRITVMTYAPSSFTGTRFFILLNKYEAIGIKNWSSLILFDGTAGVVCEDAFPPFPECDTGASIPIVRDAWVPLRVDIDLRPEGDTQSVYYDDQLVVKASWTEHVSGGGALALEAINLFSNSGDTPLYFDDLRVVELGPCGAEDLDASGDVGFSDLLAVLSGWGNLGGPEDLDESGVVDFGDLLLLLTAWGPCA